MRRVPARCQKKNRSEPTLNQNQPYRSQAKGRKLDQEGRLLEVSIPLLQAPRGLKKVISALCLGFPPFK